ncbi:hypothetical protein, partial [Rhodococcus opacus]|uniref:hypothetical protein n=1 Tax=Rhodococcus opacus TaxID=37919 RepID=UPI001A7E0ACD
RRDHPHHQHRGADHQAHQHRLQDLLHRSLTSSHTFIAPLPPSVRPETRLGGNEKTRTGAPS